MKAASPAPAQYGAGGGYDHGGDCNVDACEIERGVIRRSMEDRAADEARELADRLREPVLLADLRRRARPRRARLLMYIFIRAIPTPDCIHAGAASHADRYGRWAAPGATAAPRRYASDRALPPFAALLQTRPPANNVYGT